MNQETKNTRLQDPTEILGTLATYKRARVALESRLQAEDRVWRSVYSREGDSSSWIFNSIINKHADVIDSIPTCVCLPREKRDEADARMLSKIIPVITERCCFEQVYSDNAWEKLKHGTAVYGAFWNNCLEDGLGDIDIRAIPLERIYWEDGISDIQDSESLFILAPMPIEGLRAAYPDFSYADCKDADRSLQAMLGLSAGEGKALMVDRYYKRYLPDGRCVLHLCKLVGDRLLYCSEEDESCHEGWYHHGQYPVVFDRLYPTEGLCGFGLISIAGEAQGYINRLDENVLNYSDWASRARFWAKESLGVDEQEFLDLDRSIVKVSGDINEEKLRQIVISPLDDSVVDIKRMKIEELKEITGARDVSQGGVSGGVTAASAINILREAGAKSSRDGNAESYRAYVRLMTMVIELIRQFYDSPRIFRVVGEDGGREYLSYRAIGINGDETGYRPHFDIEVSALKKSPTEAAQKNSLAKSLYESGAFRRENAEETLMMLELMDFDGVAGLKAALGRMVEET